MTRAALSVPLLAATGLALLACGGFSPAAIGPDPVEPTPMTPKPETPAAPPKVAATNLPPAPFQPLPGWLAFTVQPRTARVHPWTPDHPNAKIVVFEPEGWEELSEGTPFRAISSQGELEIRYSELSEIPHGCDDTPTVMAAFQGPYDLGEEAVWILPSDQKGGRAFAPTAESASPTERTWKVGSYRVTVKKTAENAGELAIQRGDDLALTLPFTRAPMDGAEETPLTLEDDAVGVPVPLAAFALRENMPPVLVMRTLGYEGVKFEVFTMRDEQPLSVGTRSVYLCAY